MSHDAAAAAFPSPRENRAAMLWGIAVGLLQAATPLLIWWLDRATVYALGLVVIACIYVGFAVADGRAKGDRPWLQPGVWRGVQSARPPGRRTSAVAPRSNASWEVAIADARLGRLCFEHQRAVLVSWLLVVPFHARSDPPRARRQARRRRLGIT